MSSKPSIYLQSKTISDLTSYYSEAAATLEKYFAVQPWPPAGDPDAGALADEIAAALDGEVCSTDTDCEFYPCVIEGVGNDFFAALGIDPSEEVEGKVERLTVEKGKKSGKANTSKLLGGLSDDESVADYYDAKAISKAAKVLDGIGNVASVDLVTDNYCITVRFTLARKGTSCVGVLTIRVET